MVNGELKTCVCCQPTCKGPLCMQARKSKFGHKRMTPASLVGAVGVQKNLEGDGKNWVFKVFAEKSGSSVLVRYLGYNRDGGIFLRESEPDPTLWPLKTKDVVRFALCVGALVIECGLQSLLVHAVMRCLVWMNQSMISSRHLMATTGLLMSARRMTLMRRGGCARKQLMLKCSRTMRPLPS